MNTQEMIRAILGKERIGEELLNSLDEIATSGGNSYEYGLPVDDGTRARMREAIILWLLKYKD
jgi:hypothetical protein